MTFAPHVILVVDDDEFQRDLIAIQLANLGWKDVLLADCGAQALAYFDEYGHRVRAIISDLSMPDMDGLVLMRHLAYHHFDAPLILLSGVHDEILNSAAMLADAHGLNILGVLRKPCAPDSLAEVLTKLAPHPGVTAPSHPAVKLSALQMASSLADGEFVPWYQPKVDCRTGKPVGLEALARWPQADGGMVSPAAFIPVMEAAGLVDKLFDVMVQQVVVDMVAWRKRGIDIKVALNMSMDTAHDLNLPERLGDMVKMAGLQPADLVIEVTESRLMVDRSLAMETLTRLSLMGFVLSIDDFGTGYSSLVQLIDLPFNELKIDGSFVQRANTERKAQAILRIAMLLGQQLGMSVIAEGVETPEQLEFVRGCGGHIVQGYFFSRPLSFQACTTWLEKVSAP